MNRVLPISVVITTFNSSRKLNQVLAALASWVDEIIIVDNGSTDETLAIAQKYGSVIIHEKWHGYGENKNIGITKAKNDWILSLDSDEVVSPALQEYLLNEWNAKETGIVYRIRLLNYFENICIKHGSWGKVFNWRLFRKSEARWDLAKVHETLLIDHTRIKEKKLDKPLLHFTSDNITTFKAKQEKYARETAIKYFENKKKIDPFRPILSAIFLFIKEYIFLLGFLDGKAGFQIARERSKANYKKYRYLMDMYQ